jgi:23S rRNA pseudouridine2605 synthase
MARLQKLLAAAGLGSRRSIEELIRAGRITLAGRIARLGDQAEPGDEIGLDGRRLDLQMAAASRQVLIYYKPVGEMTTRRDPQGRPTVFERLPAPLSGRWISVGRLDVNTAGLLLLTTDGELAHRLMHPSSEIEREYLVRVRGRPSGSVIQQLRQGVKLEDGWARLDRIEQAETDGGHSSFKVVLHEGRNREVRRIWSAVGFEVSRLLRIRYGPIELPRSLHPGTWQQAPAGLIGRLAQAVGLGEIPGGPPTG